jgi:hypothetical protein
VLCFEAVPTEHLQAARALAIGPGSTAATNMLVEFQVHWRECPDDGYLVVGVHLKRSFLALPRPYQGPASHFECRAATPKSVNGTAVLTRGRGSTDGPRALKESPGLTFPPAALTIESRALWGGVRGGDVFP